MVMTDSRQMEPMYSSPSQTQTHTHPKKEISNSRIAECWDTANRLRNESEK
ncbi:predicted protein [Plenodomus lingam JN3]|uniref:Predicted protein n=1 Tax=Leptosphaeria maculans (strain JN3 / isolate v23.1.3 / race Av1-4-5-6-7-8) TaxID=985895 RepID=E4ZUB9_LEPMJ|nr:predicted protein [Plenodomus lingam JN3]CBX94998.1 predicted protein [Plenodomus lingam JN3]